MKLPSYEECEVRVEAGDGTPLHIFILNNEPADVDQCEQFRGELNDLLMYVFELTTKSG